MDNGRKGGKSFSHSEIRYTCWKFKGGKNRDRKGEITGVENDIAAWAISHSESRPDTSASIIQITMANEQDPNKITLELTGSTMKHFYVQNVAPLCLFGFGFYWQQKKNWQLDTIFISLGL